MTPVDTPTASDLLLAAAAAVPSPVDTSSASDLLLTAIADAVSDDLLADLYLSPVPSTSPPDPGLASPELFSSSDATPIPPTPATSTFSPAVIDADEVFSAVDPKDFTSAMKNPVAPAGIKVKSKVIGRQPGKVDSSTAVPTRLVGLV